MRQRRGACVVAGAAFVVVLAVGCSEEPPEPTAQPSPPAPSAASPAAGEEATATQRFPDVLDAVLTTRSDTTYDVAVTISSPYDTPERYADGWRVLTPDGAELGSHTLLHDHASEQPFTRTQSGLEIPATVDTVVVEGRDLVYGYGGGTVEVAVPDR